jgi:hypothetical protein
MLQNVLGLAAVGGGLYKNLGGTFLNNAGSSFMSGAFNPSSNMGTIDPNYYPIDYNFGG